MTWVRFDDRWSDGSDVRALSDGAFRLLHGALEIIGRNLSDGYVLKGELAYVYPRATAKIIAELVERGELRDEGAAVFVVHWEDHVLSRAKVETLSEERSEAGSRGGRRSAVVRATQASARAPAKASGQASARAAAMATGQATTKPLPGTRSPVTRIPDPEDPPNPPQAGGTSPADRARKGSVRGRDRAALKAELMAKWPDCERAVVLGSPCATPRGFVVEACEPCKRRMKEGA